MTLSLQLSPHFTLAEMCRTSQPLANIPGPGAIDRMRLLCLNVLEPVRAQFGPVKVNSGFRSALVNAAVGSRPGSQHRKGEAADIEVASASNAALAQWIATNLKFDQLILEAYHAGQPTSGWVHVSWSPVQARHQVLTMTMGSHGAVYSTGLHF